ncbi:MAG TPA: serine hydrolase [Mucilaginibacter sp.]|jgi:CubicO group peptidase (beta-lactamase class C family)
MNFKITSLLFISLVLTTLHASPQATTTAKEAIEKLQKDVPDLMQKADIPGMSIALIRDGKLVWTSSYGVMNADTRAPVTSQTVFEAASLSKCVFAYGVLKLVDQGKLNLDVPLTKYLGNNYDVPDQRINLITARHVLTHSSGFPNWREFDKSKTLQIHFDPGQKWSYSGEGFVYLSKVVEKITGMALEDFMQKTVLKPLGMNSSSYIWLAKFDSTKVYRHDNFGKVTGRTDKASVGPEVVKGGANTAASLTTNAGDYAKFIVAVLNGTGLKKDTWERMLAPGIRVTNKYPELAWGLGVGLETKPDGTWFWHWGDNGDAKAFFMASVSSKDAVVYFANSSNGLGIAREILADAVGGNHPSLDNLGYERYNSPSRRLTKSVIADGAAKALDVYREERKKDTSQMISENDMNNVGYTLIRLTKLDDALAVFKQNTDDFPQSWNAWDSYAEAYMDKGDKELAIKYYRKSLELNPQSENGKQMLARLMDEKK